MEEKVKVSVVVTAYNKQDSIEQCLTSIINSSYNNLEIIVVNDASTDDTLSVIRKIEDNRIILIDNKENMGAGLSRRVGITAASGDFVSLIDGDDFISEDFIEALVKKQVETEADIVSGGITNINPDGTRDIKLFGEKVSEGNQKLLDYGSGHIIFLNNKIVRRSLYDTVTYSDKRYCEDTPTIIPLLYYANKVAYVNNAGYFYVHSTNSLTGSVSRAKHFIACADCVAYLREYFKDKPGGDFYRECLPLSQLLGYLMAAKSAGITPESLETCLPEYINAVNYLLDNLQIQKPNKA